MYKRTHTCGDLSSNHIGDEVQLNGWINKVRLHGKIVFIDLRDRYGKTQLVFDENIFKADFDKIKKLSIEDVLSVIGVVKKRSENSENPNMKTGEVEVSISGYFILNESSPLPFVLSDRNNAGGYYRFN